MNYVILFPDEMRAESLACYGHPLVKTPNIDKLAEEGTLFEQAYTGHPVCGPARACLATGWYPHVDGRRTYYLLRKENSNFFTPLREAGFVTAHCGKDDMFTREDMGRVFNEYLPPHRGGGGAPRGNKAIETARYSMLYPPVPDELEEEQGDVKTTCDAIDFIKRRVSQKERFCLMVSWGAPHPPYIASERFYNMYDPAEVPLRGLEWMDGKPDYYKTLRKYREMKDKPEELYRKINAVYLGMISYVDMLVGRIVRALKENGIYEDTTIILCSDHGDYAGDAGQLEKWPSEMSDMVTRVPLIIRRPGCPAGHRIKTPVQSFDIMPTILDYESITPEHTHFGRSLGEQVEGKPGEEERAVYCEGGYDTREPYCFEPVCFVGSPLERPVIEGTDYYPKFMQQQEAPESVCRTVMQRYKEWKLVVRTNGQNEFYNMEKDPLEKNNLYGKEEYNDIISELEKKMLAWLIHTSDVPPIKGR